MIKIEQVGPVTKFRLARSLAGRALYFTAAYLVDGLMIDTGCAHTVRELVGALGNYAIDRIVNTHSHEDHVAGNAPLQRRLGIPVLAHPGALPFLADPRRLQLRAYQVVVWGYPEPSNGSAVGDVVETHRHLFQVIHTPGHSDDHLCLYEPDQGWLFTGDAYVGGRDRMLRRDYHIWQVIDSLKKMSALRPKVLFSGSGSVRSEAHGELVDKIGYLEEMGSQVLELHRRGWSERGIRRKMFGLEPVISYATLGHFSAANLVRSYIEDTPR